MLAKKTHNAIELNFKYDPQVVSFVKSLDGRKYSPATKTWFVPIAGAHGLVKRLEDRGFKVHEEVWEEVKKDKKMAEEAEALAVVHPRGDDEQDARQGRRRHDGGDPRQRHERRDDEALGRPLRRLLAGGLPAPGPPHRLGADAGDAASQRADGVGRALADQFAIGIVAAARERVEHDPGFERVDREQHRERERGHQNQRDIGELHGHERRGARAERREERAGGFDRPDHQRIAVEPEQITVEQREREVGGDACQQAEDRGRNLLREPRCCHHDRDRREPDHDAG